MENGSGHVFKETYVSKTKTGKNGKPEIERYQDTVAKAMKGGDKVSERQQLYQNSAIGYEKAGHERMLNSKGRKIVRERLHGTGEDQFTNYYNNVEEGMEHSRNIPTM